MSRCIVMDIVFYGNSLNYDQGTGNYQELKKITKWDGRQYTLVSRYALRYSLLETAKKMGLWDVADGSKFQRAGRGDQTVIQPSDELLLSGEILKYPEFDLFGYLITSTVPQNFREAPVKISHAVSLTPFNYDALFNANIGLANRMRKIAGEMEPNPFTAEEHETFYQYSVVVDLDRIGEIEVYIAKENFNELLEITKNNGEIKFKFEYKAKEKNKPVVKSKEFRFVQNDVNLSKIVVPFKKDDKSVKISENLGKIVEYNESSDVLVLKYQIREGKKEDRVIQLLKSILYLKRSIKGREEDLSPKLMVVGIYKNKPYRTYKDKISLVDEYCEEEYDEIIEEPVENGRKVKIVHRVSKSKKPVFEVKIRADKEGLTEDKVVKFIEEIFKEDKEEIDSIKVFYDSSIECRVAGGEENKNE